MQQLVRDFIAYADVEAPKLGRGLGKLFDAPELYDLLRRFDVGNKRTLDSKQSLLARRVLEKLHTPSAKGLKLLSQALSFMGLGDLSYGDTDVELAVEILELFCKADSVNDTLSSKELTMLLDALEKLDGNGDGVLDEDERTALRDGLWTPDDFLAELVPPLARRVSLGAFVL
jgi:hypothetical protein